MVSYYFNSYFSLGPNRSHLPQEFGAKASNDSKRFGALIRERKIYFFTQCGVPRWKTTTRTLGVIGTPLVNTHSRFLKTASYGDTLAVHALCAELRRQGEISLEY